MCFSASRRGDMEMLQWLREQGCPWGDSTCCMEAAAEIGDLALLQWMQQQWCGWWCGWGNALLRAAGAGHLHVVQWLWGQGCGTPSLTMWLKVAAAPWWQQQVMESLRSCSGCGSNHALGIGVLPYACGQHMQATWRSCSGLGMEAALGTVALLDNQ